MVFESLIGRSKKQLVSPRAAKRFRLNLEPLEDRRVLAAYINEIYFDPPASGGDLLYEYIELRGTPSQSLDDYHLIFLENENNVLNTGNPGEIEMAFDLSGLSFGTNGFLTLRQQSTPYTVAPNTTDVVNNTNNDGWGDVGSNINYQGNWDTSRPGGPGLRIDIPNSGGTVMLIHNTGGLERAPFVSPDDGGVSQDLDVDNNGLDTAANDDNDWTTYWTIEDAIGFHSEFGEAQYGRLYAPINFGPEGPTNIEPGAAYVAVGYEVEFMARWGNSTGQTAADWHISNLTDNGLSGYTGTGDFRQSGSPHGGPTFVETNQGVPYGTNLTNTLGAPNYPGVVNSTITGRHIFYNQSSWDGNSAAINAVNDNAAIATDKTAYTPGDGTAVYANITSFSRGINGIMVDLSTGVDHSGITLANVANNFVFKVGNNNTPSSWAAAPGPSAISMIAGGGVSGSDRVEITWASGSINNKWLEVQVLATAQTGLAATDVFFWGNKIADSGTGTPAGTFDTTTTDAAQVFATLGAGKPITDLRDYNRDGQVTTTDAAIVFANLGTITRISVGTGGPFAPEGDGDAGIASALASTATASTSSSSLPSGIANRLQGLNLNTGRIANFFQNLAEANTPGSRKILQKIDAVADELGLDDELLEMLVSNLSISIR